MVTPETRPYFEAVEVFLRELQEHDVTSVCMVALCADQDTHNVATCWNAGPFEKATAASVLQLNASRDYNQINSPGDDEDGEVEED